MNNMIFNIKRNTLFVNLSPQYYYRWCTPTSALEPGREIVSPSEFAVCRTPRPRCIVYKIYGTTGIHIIINTIRTQPSGGGWVGGWVVFRIIKRRSSDVIPRVVGTALLINSRTRGPIRAAAAAERRDSAIRLSCPSFDHIVTLGHPFYYISKLP